MSWALNNIISGLCLCLLCAAFDTIDHNILLFRLSLWFLIIGTVLDCFESYLSSHPFRVKCESSFSSIQTCFVESRKYLFSASRLYLVHHPSQFTHLIFFSKTPFCTPITHNFSFPFVLPMYIRAYHISMALCSSSLLR